MGDPLNEALREATMSALLGSTTAYHRTVDDQGMRSVGTIQLPSIFAERLRSEAMDGAFDALLHEAMDNVDIQAVARAVEERLADEVMNGLAQDTHAFGRREPNWLQNQAKPIAIAAVTSALSKDEALMDTLRERIGAQVDRNKVGITVQLSDPEDD